MFDRLPNISFDPYLPVAFIIGFAALAVILAAYGGYQKLRSFTLRSLAVLCLCAALLNPQTIIEDREPLSDIVPVSYTHLRAHGDQRGSRMPSSA